MSFSIEFADETQEYQARIKVVGCGGSLLTISPITLCTPDATFSVCIEFKAQLKVWGVVMVEPSTITLNPGGFDVTVICVGGAP